MLDDLFLLLDDLILLRVIWLRRLNSRGHGGVQRARAISARGKMLREMRTVALCWTFLTYSTTQSVRLTKLCCRRRYRWLKQTQISSYQGWPAGWGWRTCLCSIPPCTSKWTPDTPALSFSNSAPANKSLTHHLGIITHSIPHCFTGYVCNILKLYSWLLMMNHFRNIVWYFNSFKLFQTKASAIWNLNHMLYCIHLKRIACHVKY